MQAKRARKGDSQYSPDKREREQVENTLFSIHVGLLKCSNHGLLVGQFRRTNQPKYLVIKAAAALF